VPSSCVVVVQPASSSRRLVSLIVSLLRLVALSVRWLRRLPLACAAAARCLHINNASCVPS
jgi:hypothetical protein